MPWSVPRGSPARAKATRLEVEVADAHRVLVAECAGGHLRDRPRPDPWYGAQARFGIGRRQVHDPFEPGRAGADPADEVGPALLDTERVVGVVGQPGERLRRGGRRNRQAGGPGAGSPWTAISPNNARCASRPVTFCSRIAGTRDSMTAPVRGIRTPG